MSGQTTASSPAVSPTPTPRPLALVTGATRGLGRAIADILAPDHRVLVGGRDPRTVGSVVDSLPDAAPFVADLRDADAVRCAVERWITPVGRLNLVVHNAGIAGRGTVESTTRDQWRATLETDVVAVADLTRLLLPYLRSADDGLVVVINSGSGLRGYPGDAAYCAAKFALRGLTDCLREEERGRVRVTSIHPGRIDTDMQVALQTAQGRPYDAREHMDPRDVAATVRLAVDLPATTTVEELSVRPVRALH